MTRSTVFFTTLSLTLLSFAACGTTGGRAITLTLSLERTGETHFTTATGWDVVLDEAELLVGAVYALGPERTAARLETALLPVARAHGGLDPYSGRPVRGEWLTPTAIDLVGGPVVVGVGLGTAGETSSGTVLLDAPRGALADPSGPLHGHHAWISGTATNGATTIGFEGGIDLPDEGTTRLVEGIPLEAHVDDGGELRLHVALSRWLDAVHFDRLPDAGSAPREITPGTQAEIAWRYALRDPRSWSLEHVVPAAGGGI